MMQLLLLRHYSSPIAQLRNLQKRKPEQAQSHRQCSNTVVKTSCSYCYTLQHWQPRTTDKHASLNRRTHKRQMYKAMIAYIYNTG